MEGKVRAWWLNALIITTTLLIWLSVAASIIAGIAIASASGSGSATSPQPTESSDNDISVGEEGCHWDFDENHWADEYGERCIP